MVATMGGASRLPPILWRSPRPSPLHHNRSPASWVPPGEYAAAAMLNSVVIRGSVLAAVKTTMNFAVLWCVGYHMVLSGSRQQCANCKRVVHVHRTTTIFVHLHCIECASPAAPAPQSGKRKFVPHLKKGGPWLQYVDEKMLCAACRAYPQFGSPADWIQGTTNFPVSRVKDHEKFGPHNIPLALGATVQTGLYFCHFCVENWVTGFCTWHIFWFCSFLMV